MDTASIELGAEWPETIQRALASASTFIPIIGPNWLRAGSDDWGLRPIDKPLDWVRCEIKYALESGKNVIPVLVRDATIPPEHVLPVEIRGLLTKEALSIRGHYWDHDVKLLLRQLDDVASVGREKGSQFDPYPVPPEEDVELIPAYDDKKLGLALQGLLQQWKKLETELPEDLTKNRAELFREFKFDSFQDAIDFMSQVAKGCDIANHHPRWENIWKTLRVYLTTWNIGHRISDRDVQLARYFETAYLDFVKRARKK